MKNIDATTCKWYFAVVDVWGGACFNYDSFSSKGLAPYDESLDKSEGSLDD